MLICFEILPVEGKSIAGTASSFSLHAPFIQVRDGMTYITKYFRKSSK